MPKYFIVMCLLHLTSARIVYPSPNYINVAENKIIHTQEALYSRRPVATSFSFRKDVFPKFYNLEGPIVHLPVVPRQAEVKAPLVISKEGWQIKSFLYQNGEVFAIFPIGLFIVKDVESMRKEAENVTAEKTEKPVVDVTEVPINSSEDVKDIETVTENITVFDKEEISETPLKIKN